MLQIHQQKREVIEHVDAGEAFVELEAIEQGRLSAKKTDIAEMQIAVTMAYFARRTPAVEQLRRSRKPFSPFLANRSGLDHG